MNSMSMSISISMMSISKFLTSLLIFLAVEDPSGVLSFSRSSRFSTRTETTGPRSINFFATTTRRRNQRRCGALAAVVLRSSATTEFDDEIPTATDATVNEIKAKLVQVCGSSAVTMDRVQSLVRDLEEAAETAGIGQASAVSGLLSGQWELLYCSEDDTRSSPFFWAFRQAFPEQSDQIFGITDAIPAPLKEVGPATQTIDFSAATQTGTLVSRVKVATLGGAATSTMTTRATITGTDGVDGIRLQIDTTKPEESTVLRALGPLGSLIDDSAPAFPSGQALEQVAPGASQVVVRTPFCDDGLRISRNDARPDDDFCVWRRTDFATSEVL